MFPAYAYLSAYDRHKKLINDYFALRGGSALSLQRDTSRDKTDLDVIRENHRFLWEEDEEESEEAGGSSDKWAIKLAKKYYDKLFKEYCICDLSYYKSNKVALRWRTEREVVMGKGQFECAGKKCQNKQGLRSCEVNFRYEEHGDKKNALVKLRLCAECSDKLNYTSQKREVGRKKIGELKGPGGPERRSRFDNGASSTSSTTGEESNISRMRADGNIVEAEGIKREPESPKHLDETTVWKRKTAVEGVEKSREEEFEQYLADLLL